MSEKCSSSRDRRFSGRQITIMVVAVCVTLIATPVAALAATASFSSNSASTPAVSAKNTASGSGAKGVYGNAAATSGSVYGVYGRAGSPQGYGVYSAGRLGSSGALVCSHCVTAGDVNAAGFPTVPNASQLGGHGPSYYARVIPMSSILPFLGQEVVQADVDGVTIFGLCDSLPDVHLGFRADSTASNGTLNYYLLKHGGTVTVDGGPVSTGNVYLSAGPFDQQVEGTAIYRNTATGQIVTVNFHMYPQNCELFGEIITAG